MDTFKLSVETRDPSVKASAVRSHGRIPAVYYGAGQDNMNISVDYQDFRRLFNKAGSHSIVEIEIDGKSVPTMIHDVQYDPVTDNYTHADFIMVNMDKEITTEVPIEFIGEAPAVKDLGGTLMTNRDVVEVKCLPKNLPEKFVVDISVLEDFQISIHMSDLEIPKDVELLVEEGITIATVVAPKAEEEEEAPEEGEGVEGEEGAEGEGGEKAAEGGEAKAEGSGDEKKEEAKKEE